MITALGGAHLTATDRRNIKALMNHPSFVLGHRFQINGRKTYTIFAPAPDWYEVLIGSIERDGFGRRTEVVYRSTFTRKEPS